MKLRHVLYFFLLVCAPGLAFSQKTYTTEFAFKSDNDAYLAQGQDRYYTNGIFLSFRHAMKEDSLSANLSKRIWELELGQKMYNAQSGNIPDIIFVDRPFAAYLYVGGSMNWIFKDQQVLKATAQAGMIGPAALGEDAQKLLHNLAGFYPIAGWQYQVRNEFQVNTSVNYTSLLQRNTQSTADLSLNAYANIGTTFTGAGAGLILRLGDINSLVNSALVNSRISNSSKATEAARELFFYAQPMLNIIGYDATISGGLLHENKGPVVYDPKRLVFSQELGVMVAQKRWTLDFSLIFKTKEVQSVAKPHQYGNISAFYRFN